VNKPVDLNRLRGVGPVWGIASEDLNATVLFWEPGQGVEEHSNTERDVLMIAIEGSGTVAIDGREHVLLAHHALLIEKGTRRRVTAGVDGLRYVSVHRCRGPLQIELAETTVEALTETP
jgi:mannose-6-phosphate isomerase-like protein (cupin superfamily)